MVRSLTRAGALSIAIRLRAKYATPSTFTSALALPICRLTVRSGIRICTVCVAPSQVTLPPPASASARTGSSSVPPATTGPWSKVTALPATVTALGTWDATT